MSDQQLHKNEIQIDLAGVRDLIDHTFPQYRSHTLTPLAATGSTNRLFQLGDRLLVRLPRQPGSGKALQTESRWSPFLAAHLPFEIPEIVTLINANEGYPEPWAILQRLPGTHPDTAAPHSPMTQDLARDLAAFIVALREVEIPDHALQDSSLKHYRGDPLAGIDRYTRKNIEQCRNIEGLDLDLDLALQVWSASLKLPQSDPTRTGWYHSDLVAENLLLNDGRLSAVLDFGGLGIGDPTIDLHGAWELFDPQARAIFREQIGASEAEWLRGRAWALAVALMTFAYYWDSLPRRAADRLVMARQVLTDAQRSGF